MSSPRSAVNSDRVAREGVGRPLRLCAIVHGPFPNDSRVLRAVRVALEKGWQVDVLATRQPGELRREVVDGATVMRLPIAHRWGGGALNVAREYIGFTFLATAQAARLAVRRRYDAVHVHNPPDFLIVAAAVPRLLGAEVIFDIHDLSPDMFDMRFGGRRGARVGDRVLRLIEGMATRFADVVLTVHEPYRRELATRGVPPQKILVVMNTVDERFLPLTSGAEEGFRIVYQGTITPPYGLHLLVQAAAEISDDIPETRLEIYGDGDSLPEVRSLVRALDLEDRVYLSGKFLPHTEVLERVRSASVGVICNLPIPLNRFALSEKLFEYVVLGIPVVSADLPTIREHFNDSEVLFFCAGDAHALAAALLQIRREPEAAALRAHAAFNRYEQYRWPLQSRRYAELLNRLIEGDESQGP
jgi:glycosyltransferase involved in cell wall biosynthesis